MDHDAASHEFVSLLNDALARELQVSVQYMLQHAVGIGRAKKRPEAGWTHPQGSFIASHTPYFLPGARLKKIAITEMRHAEAIAERIVLLGGEPTTQPHLIAIGVSSRGMLEIDLAAEQEAIHLYTQIIAAAERDGDQSTGRLFRKILSDERKHHQILRGLLG